MSVQGFHNSEVRLELADGLVPFRSGGLCREDRWPFASGLNFGRRSAWWLWVDDLDGFEDASATFCEALLEARDFYNLCDFPNPKTNQ